MSDAVLRASQDLNSNDDDCGRNREELLGQRSDFSRPRQGAAEKSANATRESLTVSSLCGSQRIGMSKGVGCRSEGRQDLNSNDDDRSQRLKQGGVVGAAF